MFNKAINRLVFQTIYIVLGIIGVFGSLGYFDRLINIDFYIYYTNISNYFCLIIMIICFYKTIKNIKNNNYSSLDFCPQLYFVSMIILIMTFLVFNIGLLLGYNINDYVFNLGSLCFHMILPIMYTLHWFLFYKHGLVLWHNCFATIIPPIIYILSILLRANLIRNPQAVKFPYFFLDINTIGLYNFYGYIILLIFIMLLISFICYIFDKSKSLKRIIDDKN